MSIPFDPGDKIFVYLRDSGHEEQDLSIDQQKTAIEQWAAENSIIVSQIFKDEARRGSTVVGRTGLQSLMHAFRHQCEAKGVVIWRYNRFARSIDNQQFYRAEIRTRGYIFYSLNDKVPEGPMGRLIEAAIDFKDEQFLIDLSGDVKRGLKDLVEKYGCVPGPAPRGLKREKVVIGTRRDGAAHVAHRWIPDPDIAPRVLRAFEMRAQRLSLGAIQNETRFYSGVNSYRTFFSNPIYKGALQYAELFIDDYCDPIVSKELWDQVQAIQNHYQHRRHTSSEGIDHPRRANSRFLLSGIGKCGHCGSPLYGRSTPQKSGKSYDSYLCTRAYRKRDCTRSRIPRAAFEDAVIATLTDYILTPETFAAAYTELQNSQKGRLSVEDRKRRELTTDLGKIRRQINNIANSIAEIGGSKSLHTKLQDLEIQETNIQSQLAKLESNADQPVQPISPEVIQANAAELLTRFQSAHESDCLRQIRFIGRSSTSRSSQSSSPG